MLLSVSVAHYLDSLGLLTFDESGITGDTFINVMPSEPENAIVITGYPGPAPDVKHGYDRPNIQLRARAGRDPRTAQERLADIYAALHNLHGVELPGGTYIVSCVAIQSGPAPLGPDQNGRHEFTHNYQLETRNVTAHRV